MAIDQMSGLRQRTGSGAVNGMIFNCHFFRAYAKARPHLPFYFWLNPKVTKDQEPIKGDFAFGKPRSLLPLHAFIAGLTNSAFLFLLCIIELSPHFTSSAIPAIAIPLVAPHITGDGFDLLILFLFSFDSQIWIRCFYMRQYAGAIPQKGLRPFIVYKHARAGSPLGAGGVCTQGLSKHSIH